MNGRHRGPPPSIGWWPTQAGPGYARGNRWWNGEFWSFAPSEGDPLETVEWCARQPSGHRDLLWSERPADWPERSRT